MPVGFSDGSTYADQNEWLADSFAKVEGNTSSTMPLGASQELTGAFKSPEGTQTPEKVQNDFLQVLTGTPNPRPVTDILMDFAKEKGGKILDALKLPGDAWAGKVDPMSTQGLERATTLAGLMVGGPAPVASKMADGTLGSFAGVTSKTLDKTKLYKAQDMELQSAHPDEIWQQTGFFRGADSRWRYEIPDDTANILDKGTIRVAATEDKMPMDGSNWELGKPATLKVKENPIPVDKIDAYLEGKFTPGDTYLEDVLHHPELFKAYPALKDITVFPMPKDLPYNGMVRDGQIFMAELPVDQFQSTLLHEVQHVIQTGEGFAKGGNPGMFTPPKLEEAAQRFAKVKEATEKELIQDKGWSEFDISQIKNLIRREETLSPEYKKSLEKFKKDHPEDYDRLSNIVKSEDLLADQSFKQNEQYKRLMGEVESRNVQARMDMDSVQRLMKSPRSTEDRPRFVQVDSSKVENSASTGPSDPHNPRWLNDDEFYRWTSTVPEHEMTSEQISRLRSIEKAGETVTTYQPKIRSASIKIGDKIYEGSSHFEAMQKAEKDGVDLFKTEIFSEMQDGFMTNAGKFVTREEAAKIEGGISDVLLSEDLPHLNPERAKEWWHELNAETRKPSK